MTGTNSLRKAKCCVQAAVGWGHDVTFGEIRSRVVLLLTAISGVWAGSQEGAWWGVDH